MERTCWVVGGGAHGKNVNEENNVTDFPGVDNEALRFPPWANDLREHTLTYDTVIKWCV